MIEFFYLLFVVGIVLLLYSFVFCFVLSLIALFVGRKGCVFHRKNSCHILVASDALNIAIKSCCRSSVQSC